MTRAEGATEGSDRGDREQHRATPSEPMSAPADDSGERATVFVRGHVQGVGFRWWTRARALELGLSGHARNTSDGRVEVVTQGPRPAIERLHTMLSEQPSTTRRPGRVVHVSTPLWGPARADVDGFVER